METIQTVRLSPQCIDILRFLDENGSITGMQSVLILGVMNYKARISELRKAGVPIEKKWVTATNGSGKRKHFAVYSIRGTK